MAAVMAAMEGMEGLVAVAAVDELAVAAKGMEALAADRVRWVVEKVMGEDQVVQALLGATWA
eukprot:CAMPEP_0119309854 /NCGR_PEP_ID=MMETSP1333-20130426/17219_1 /TAXON_ID=418940 /ORGANISM="Scyphosphaera apsteinii, Strain RCC1455" /LENGTH=61 /DNA_ID=CAMNT_0007313915 /DNA_START=337 /DNA_END=522 /DNA_ORIENTATION=+